MAEKRTETPVEVDGHHLRSLPLHFVAGLEDEPDRHGFEL